MGLQGDGYELRRDVEKAAIFIGPEALARGREKRLARSAAAVRPVAARAEKMDLADYLLMRLPL